MHAPPAEAAAALDKCALPPKISGRRSVGPSSIERFRIPKKACGGYRWDDPTSPKAGPATTELDTTTRDETKAGKTRTSSVSGTKGGSPARGDKDAPSPGPRGGYRETPLRFKRYRGPNPKSDTDPTRTRGVSSTRGSKSKGMGNNSIFFSCSRPPPEDGNLSVSHP